MKIVEWKREGSDNSLSDHDIVRKKFSDFLSLTGEGYIPSIYKKYGRVISLMGKLYCSSIKNLVNLYIQGVNRAFSSCRKWQPICLLTGKT